MVICLERGVDLHMAQLMPLPLTVSCFIKIQISFTFLVPAHLGSPGKSPLNVYIRCVDGFSWRSRSRHGKRHCRGDAFCESQSGERAPGLSVHCVEAKFLPAAAEQRELAVDRSSLVVTQLG